jgi:hypothetical protein
MGGTLPISSPSLPPQGHTELLGIAETEGRVFISDLL